MQRKTRPRPTDAELAILNVLFETGPATVRQVHEALPEANRRGYTTTLKLMQIMAEKGLAERDESNRSHVYTALGSEQELQSRLVDELMSKAFDGSAAKLVMRALSDKRASKKELAEIRSMLDQLDRGGRR